eukprot:SAG22_NODE_217_length_14910_cov_65.532978_6_plen_2053_part_00
MINISCCAPFARFQFTCDDDLAKNIAKDMTARATELAQSKRATDKAEKEKNAKEAKSIALVKAKKAMLESWDEENDCVEGAGTEYRAIATGVVRAGFDKGSDRLGEIQDGELITCLGSKMNDDMQLRVRFDYEGVPGWVSMTTATGKLLLEDLNDDLKSAGDANDGNDSVASSDEEEDEEEEEDTGPLSELDQLKDRIDAAIGCDDAAKVREVLGEARKCTEDLGPGLTMLAAYAEETLGIDVDATDAEADSEKTANPDVLGEYKAVASSTIRETVDLESEKIGAVKPGEVIEVTASETLETGQVRVQFDKGWTSLTSREGKKLFVKVGEEDEAEPEPEPAPAPAKKPRRRMSISGGFKANVAPAAAQDGMHDVKMKSKKVQVKVGGMGLDVFEKGRKLETHMYMSMLSWGDRPGKGFEIIPKDGKEIVFTCADDVAKTIIAEMTSTAKELAASKKEAKKAAKEAEAAKADAPEGEEDAGAETTIADRGPTSMGSVDNDSSIKTGVDAAALPAALQDGMHDVKMKSKKVQVKVGGMGLDVFEKGRKLETHMYMSMLSWGDRPGKGFEIIPKDGKQIVFTCADDVAKTIIAEMTSTAKELAASKKEAKKAAKEAEAAKADAPEGEEDAGAETTIADRGPTSMGSDGMQHETLYDAKWKGKKVQVKVSGMGLQVFEKGKISPTDRVLETYMYQTLLSWGDKPGVGIEIVPKDEKVVQFQCLDEDAAKIIAEMGEVAKELVASRRAAKQAAKQAESAKAEAASAENGGFVAEVREEQEVTRAGGNKAPRLDDSLEETPALEISQADLVHQYVGWHLLARDSIGVSAGIDLDSDIVGTVDDGDTLQVLDAKVLDDNIRIQFDRGWINLKSDSGTALLCKVDGSVPSGADGPTLEAHDSDAEDTDNDDDAEMSAPAVDASVEQSSFASPSSSMVHEEYGTTSDEDEDDENLMEALDEKADVETPDEDISLRGEYRTKLKATIRESVDRQSKIIGNLAIGEVINVLETVRLETGQLRVRFDRGWTSETAGDGRLLLVKVDEDDDEPSPAPPPAPAPSPAKASPSPRGKVDALALPDQKGAGVTMFDVKLKGKKTQVQVGGMGLQLFSKGRAIETYMYHQLASWGERPGKGFEVARRDDDTMISFACDDSTAVRIIGMMNNTAAELVESKRAANKAAKVAKAAAKAEIPPESKAEKDATAAKAKTDPGKAAAEGSAKSSSADAAAKAVKKSKAAAAKDFMSSTRAEAEAAETSAVEEAAARQIAAIQERVRIAEEEAAQVSRIKRDADNAAVALAEKEASQRLAAIEARVRTSEAEAAAVALAETEAAQKLADIEARVRAAEDDAQRRMLSVTQSTPMSPEAGSVANVSVGSDHSVLSDIAELKAMLTSEQEARRVVEDRMATTEKLLRESMAGSTTSAPSIAPAPHPPGRDREEAAEGGGGDGMGRIGEYATMLQKVPLLRSLTDDERTDIAKHVKTIEVEDGDAVVAQGDAGDAMYIIQSGAAKAFVDGVQGCVMEYGSGDFFGELALTSNQPRAATVKGSGFSTTLIKITQEVFVQLMSANADIQKLIEQQASAYVVPGRIGEYVSMLRKVPLLKSLTDSERTEIARQVQTVELEDGDSVIRQGEAGDAMYIVQSGSAQAFVTGVRGCVMEYGSGDFFGELALRSNQPRAATVVVNGFSTTLIKITQAVFVGLMSQKDDVRELIEQQANQYLYPGGSQPPAPAPAPVPAVQPTPAPAPAPRRQVVYADSSSDEDYPVVDKAAEFGKMREQLFGLEARAREKAAAEEAARLNRMRERLQMMDARAQERAEGRAVEAAVAAQRDHEKFSSVREYLGSPSPQIADIEAMLAKLRMPLTAGGSRAPLPPPPPRRGQALPPAREPVRRRQPPRQVVAAAPPSARAFADGIPANEQPRYSAYQQPHHQRRRPTSRVSSRSSQQSRSPPRDRLARSKPPPPPGKRQFKAAQQQQQLQQQLGRQSAGGSVASTSRGSSPVKATLTLRQNFRVAVGQNAAAGSGAGGDFETGFAAELASFLGVPADRVKVSAVPGQQQQQAGEEN